jgi:hypothetical protein
LLDGKLKVSETTFTPGKLTLVVVNGGKLSHGLAIAGAHLPLKRTATIGSGMTTKLTLTVGVGSYRVWDPVRSSRGHATPLMVRTSCSRSSLRSCPASFFTGPLGKNPLHPGRRHSESFNYTALGSTAVSQHDLWGPHKPFVICETGTWNDSQYPTSNGNWFRGIPSAAKKMLYLRGVSFYDVDVSGPEGRLNNFRVDYPTSDTSAYAGFKQMAADPWFNTG